jgi:branched-chain amino acid transport system substrate-binding protein
MVAGAVPAAGSPAVGGGTTIRVGALFDLSGDGKTLGLASQAALEVAAEEIEEASDGEVTVELDIRDTALDPMQASAELQSLLDSGIRVIIGPQTSSEVRATIDQVNAAGALMISHGSTASSLALPDDGVYRLVPDDRVEGAATAELIADQGKSGVVTVHRNDPGNNGLVESVTAAFSGAGGTVVAGPVYEPDTTDFSATITALEPLLASAGDDPAVYLAGFEEVADLFAAATAGSEALAGATWYGGDGSARGQSIIDNEQSADFASDVGGFASPLLILSKKVQKKAADTIEAIEESSGEEPDAFALAAYDALQIAVEALSIVPDAQGAELRTAFAEAASGYPGVTGKIELNAAGDRSTGSYAFYAVCDSDDEFEWQSVGSWAPPKTEGEPGTVKFGGC